MGNAVPVVAPNRVPELAPEPSLAASVNAAAPGEDPGLVETILRARSSGQTWKATRAPDNAQPGVLEFMEPEPRNQAAAGRSQFIGNGGYIGHGAHGDGRDSTDKASQELAGRLESL